MTDILVYTEEQGNVIAGSVQPDRMTVAVLGAVGGGTGGSGAVSSVNGQIGHVVLDAADVGADPAGTGASAASAAVAAHVAAADPHPQYTTAAEAAASAPVQSVNTQTGAVVLDAADVGADAAGTAAAAVSAHETDPTPHAVITQVDRFGFDTTAGLTAGVGEMVWNAADGTADLGLPGGVTLQVGQEGLIRVLNKTGGTIQNMHVVYLTGAQGNRITAAQAQANSVNADKTLAVATQDIANNAEGFATILGLVRGVDTSAWAEGTELWLSAATPGAITNVRPSAPNHQVRVGYVVRSHATQGVIYVTINIGGDLEGLHDVVVTAPVDGDVLVYDSATQTWQNAPQTGGSGEVNTASNLGSGAGVFASKVGADLQFKSLVAGSGVTLTPTGTTITITASGAGGAVDSVNGQTGVVVLDTDDVAEGATNLYHTPARAAAAAPVQSVNGQTGAVNLSGSYAPLSHVGSGGAAHATVVAGGDAGFMSGADKTKLDSIASGATANATDAQLRDRSTHTGTQTASTIIDFNSVARAQVEAELVAGTNVTITPSGSGASRQLTISASSGASLAQVVAYTGTAKTLALTDINTIVDCTSSSAVTITIPPQSSVTWSADAEIHVRMSGTGAVSIAVGSGVTIPPLSAPVGLGGQGAIVTLKRRSSDVWMIAGVTVPQQLGTPYASAGGTANAITLTTNYAPAKQTALVAGHQVRARVGTTNTGTTTMALDGLTAKSCVTVTGAALPAGYIRTGVDTEFTYDVTGDRWIVGREAEYGSNANGTFLRFADGRQECRHNLTGLTASLGAGALFYSPSAQWTFPAAFIAAPPKLGAFATRTGGSGLVWPGQSNETASTTSMTFRMVSSTSGAEASILVSANGSWY